MSGLTLTCWVPGAWRAFGKIILIDIYGFPTSFASPLGPSLANMSRICMFWFQTVNMNSFQCYWISIADAFKCTSQGVAVFLTLWKGARNPFKTTLRHPRWQNYISLLCSPHFSPCLLMTEQSNNPEHWQQMLTCLWNLILFFSLFLPPMSNTNSYLIWHTGLITFFHWHSLLWVLISRLDKLDSNCWRFHQGWWMCWGLQANKAKQQFLRVLARAWNHFVAA